MEYKSCKIYETETEKCLQGLRVAVCMNVDNLDEDPSNYGEKTIPYNLKELSVSDVLSCSYCRVSFTNALDQRNHYKLDWHRYNLKRALSGNQPLPEDDFFTLADDVSSISGSDSESNSEDTDTDVTDMVKKPQEQNCSHEFGVIRHTKIFFENKENKILSVYRCMLCSKKECPVKDELVSKLYDLIRKPKRWMVIMLGGGHFAAGVFENGVIIHHKTFHCYTVRAKQGGSQSSRDNKGGCHSKSAGASLRRYNEQALAQHVQEIMAAWSESIKQCSLILCRATGPYNRGVLFGGKNPPLSKSDPRLRNIPFPTRRATFNEVKRVHDLLSSVEIYGSADDFKDKFPRSPDKRVRATKATTNETPSPRNDVNAVEQLPGGKDISKKDRAKGRSSPQRELPGENIRSPVESSDEEGDEYELISDSMTISFQDLQEHEDTVPQWKKDAKNNAQQQKRKRKKLNGKQKVKLERKKWSDEFERIHGNLTKSCKNGDVELLMENLNIYAELPERSSLESNVTVKGSDTFAKEDFIDCLNTTVSEEDKNTLLHLAALKCLPEFVTLLLTAGADPTLRNKNKQTPYMIAGNKETRDSFKSFVTSFPDKYHLKKANIPEPLTEEMEKELEEKKKEKKKLKRIKEKIKKREDKEKKFEEKEKERFLALSDREKCALAAERRLVASSTTHLKSVKPPVLSRCFQCGADITGKVPFEYGSNRFCSIPCLKVHRAKTNSYGVAI